MSNADGKFKHGTLFKLKTDGEWVYRAASNFYGGDDDGESPRRLCFCPMAASFVRSGKVFHYDPKSQQFAIVKLDARADVPNMLAGCAADGTIVGLSGGFAILWAGDNVVSMAPDGSNYASFANGQNVATGQPVLMYSRIIAGKDGTFFAISTNGGGSLVNFKSLKDPPTVVHKFAALPTDGNRPDVDLVLDNKGNLYGSTSAGGMSQNGVVYKVNADGSNYQVVYNPDTFAFSRVFVPGDDGMLYGIAEKGGVLQLNADGSGKPPTTLVAFDWSKIGNNRGTSRGMPNITFHNGAVYARDNAAIYKVTLPKAGTGVASATPTVAIKTIQPQPLASEAIAITDPTGAASAGTAAPSTPAAPTAAQQPTQQSPAAQADAQQGTQTAQTQQQTPTPSQVNKATKKAKKGKDAADQLKGLLGH